MWPNVSVECHSTIHFVTMAYRPWPQLLLSPRQRRIGPHVDAIRSSVQFSLSSVTFRVTLVSKITPRTSMVLNMYSQIKINVHTRSRYDCWKRKVFRRRRKCGMLIVTAQKQRLQAVHSIFAGQKRWTSDYRPYTVWTTAPPPGDGAGRA